MKVLHPGERGLGSGRQGCYGRMAFNDWFDDENPKNYETYYLSYMVEAEKTIIFLDYLFQI